MGAEQSPRNQTHPDLFIASEEDRRAITWAAEQYVADILDIRNFLRNLPSTNEQNKERRINLKAAEEITQRWVQAGWVRRRGDSVWPTNKGLELVGLDTIFQEQEPKFTQPECNHRCAMNMLRFRLEEDEGFEWISERRYRSMLEMNGEDPFASPIPDALVRKEGSDIVAILIDFWAREPDEIIAKLERLANATNIKTEDQRQASPRFPLIRIYVPNDKTKTSMLQIRTTLSEAHQERISVHTDAFMMVMALHF